MASDSDSDWPSTPDYMYESSSDEEAEEKSTMQRKEELEEVLRAVEAIDSSDQDELKRTLAILKRVQAYPDVLNVIRTKLQYSNAHSAGRELQGLQDRYEGRQKVMTMLRAKLLEAEEELANLHAAQKISSEENTSHAQRATLIQSIWRMYQGRKWFLENLNVLRRKLRARLITERLKRKRRRSEQGGRPPKRVEK